MMTNESGAPASGTGSHPTDQAPSGLGASRFDPSRGIPPLTTLTPDSVTDGYCDAGASISACGKYRYRLWREWRSGSSNQWDMWTEDDGVTPAMDGAGSQLGKPKSCVFVMLNPSTADAKEDDPTIRRCVGFAKALGYDRLEVVNLFAWRATDPREVLAMGGDGFDPVGFRNQDAVTSALEGAGIVICAWGAHGGHLGQDETMLGWIEGHWSGLTPHALKTTKDGFPGHPLYLPSHLRPTPYRGRSA